MSPRLRLAARTVAGLPPAVARPAYDPAAVRVGIVHLGIGAFHRAHQAVYVDDRLAAGETGWGICGASLRSADTADALGPQDGLYTVAERSGAGTTHRVIGAVRRLLVLPRDPEAVLAALSDPAVRIVSLTVTEKGYCHAPATGALREDHPDIVADLRAPDRPRSMPGLLVEALRRRRDAGAGPVTVLSCDNLPENGRLVAGVLARMAALRDPGLGRWIGDAVACPSTMVDRIVPATGPEDREAVAEALGLHDAWPVIAEPFRQWVVEDRFARGRPRWEESGVRMVADVAPFELMKLRLLNASHSALAYLGGLACHPTIAEAIGDPVFRRFVAALMAEEVRPTLRLPAGTDVPGYEAALIARFDNPALRHRTAQIATDGSQKLPQLAVAGWMRHATGRDERGGAVAIQDPLAARLRAVVGESGPEAGALARGFLGIREVFGTDLPADPRFVAAVTDALAALLRDGARRTVAAVA